MKNILCFLLLVLCVQSFASGIADVKSVRRTFSFHADRIYDVSMLLSKIYLVPVCSEEARYLPRKDDSEEFKKILEEKKKLGFDIKADKLTLPELLDDFVKKYPDYKWEEDPKNVVFNIFPKENAPADIIRENVKLEKMSLRDILMFNLYHGENKTEEEELEELRQSRYSDKLNLLSDKIMFELGRGGFVSGNYYWIDTKTITINEEKAKLRNIFNQMCRQLPMPTFWVIEEVKSFYYNRKETIYGLRFRFYEPFESSPDKQGDNVDDIYDIYRLNSWERWYKELNKQTGVEFDIRAIVKERVKSYEKLKDRFMPENEPVLNTPSSPGSGEKNSPQAEGK